MDAFAALGIVFVNNFSSVGYFRNEFRSLLVDLFEIAMVLA